MISVVQELNGPLRTCFSRHYKMTSIGWKTLVQFVGMNNQDVWVCLFHPIQKLMTFVHEPTI
jgi:hypothetical protein